jgi:hypothetical protein
LDGIFGNHRVPKWGFKTEAPTFDPRFDIGGQLGGWHYGVRAYAGYGGEVGSDGEAKRGPEVNSYSAHAGVLGTGVYVAGVAGTSVNHVGVYGQAGEPSMVPKSAIGAGVFGVSYDKAGIIGLSERSNGVEGVSLGEHAVYGGAGGDRGRSSRSRC